MYVIKIEIFEISFLSFTKRVLVRIKEATRFLVELIDREFTSGTFESFHIFLQKKRKKKGDSESVPNMLNQNHFFSFVFYHLLLYNNFLILSEYRKGINQYGNKSEMTFIKIRRKWNFNLFSFFIVVINK